MKKIYLIIATIMLTFSSCSMDLTPEGEIRDDEALIKVSDYERFTNGLYALMRSITSGDYIILSDIQLDDFHAVIGNGNRRMEFYNGSFTPSTGEIASFYSAYYSVIAQTNFFIEKAQEKLTDTSLTSANIANMKQYLGVAHFIRAYCYNCLADKFCASYKNSNNVNKDGTGLSLQLVYAPSADNTKYPGRSSLYATYSQILSDLNSALSEITFAEGINKTELTPNSNYINSNTVKALLARVNLNMGNDDEARKYAEDVLGQDIYILTERNSYKTLWSDDRGSEVIWQIQADFTYHGNATGTAFMSNTTNSDYIPTKECIELFDENDIRWTVWFEDTNISNSSGNAQMFRFCKYPGNSELYASSAGSNFVNKAKPFRSAELYLIAAEAYFNMNKEKEANDYLKKLKASRINRYNSKNLTGAELLESIQDERHRELIGEGFRLADLKRWNLGFTRGTVWEDNDKVIVSNFKNLHYDADDYRFVWPIPQHEIDANPQVKQNPGYINE